jgi:hydrogenase nickel incorporation protein HypA/HybF
MSQVVPDMLIFGFDLLSKETVLEGANLIIESVPTRGCCKNCGKEFVIKDFLDNCPECDGMSFDIVSGKELEIVEFTGE